MFHRTTEPHESLRQRLLRVFPMASSRVLRAVPVASARVLRAVPEASSRVLKSVPYTSSQALLQRARVFGRSTVELGRSTIEPHWRDGVERLERRWRRLRERVEARGRRWAIVALFFLVPVGLLWLEVQTSLIESGLFSSLAQRLDYRVAQAPSSKIAFPSGSSSGPFDTQRGYSEIPRFAHALRDHGFRIAEQSRFSDGLMWVSRLGVPLPGRYKPLAGLVIDDARSDTLYDATRGHRVFARYEDIPPVVTHSLLYLENRQLVDGGSSLRNPALDWGRLAKASLLWTGRQLGLPLRIEGGSTLAVQLQKYRHSSNGRTHSPGEKLRQIAAASLNAYRDGPNTDQARHQVVLDYINTLPLAATPEYGEVSGLMDGLRVWFGLQPEAVWRAMERGTAEERARAYAPVLALLCAGQAPTYYLRHDHAALERRMRAYTRLFEVAGVIDPKLAHTMRATPLDFASRPLKPGAPFVAARKSADAIRRDLSTMLGVPNSYDLNRLDLQVQTTFDNALQSSALQLFHQLGDSAFVAAHGLRGQHMLATGDPSRIAYSLLLFESEPGGDHACAHIDNLKSAFDLNTGAKLELGSTAKLRTLTHYLEIVYGLHGELRALPTDRLAETAGGRARHQRGHAPRSFPGSEVLGVAVGDLLDRRRRAPLPQLRQGRRSSQAVDPRRLRAFDEPGVRAPAARRGALSRGAAVLRHRLRAERSRQFRAQADAGHRLRAGVAAHPVARLPPRSRSHARQALRARALLASHVQARSGSVLRLEPRHVRGRAGALARAALRGPRHGHRAVARARVRQPALHAARLCIPDRHASSRAVVSGRAAPRSGGDVGQPMGAQRRHARAVRAMALRAETLRRPEPSHPSADRERSLRLDRRRLAPRRIPVQEARALVGDHARRLGRPPPGTRQAGGRHRRRRRRAPADGHRATGVRRGHAVPHRARGRGASRGARAPGGGGAHAARGDDGRGRAWNRATPGRRVHRGR
ncbi:MAG: hypothetical protein E6K80_00735 [Candidatus Eisenbacteria bacterium]|uniref:Glycosyl transferase family 51 domain-containing protein n=1 Tax=Eiseniibacteriota bacterium TaxID=2212470 RepID=A0A538UBE9_UNCEI|nr:MAG: hypothetical protein E6K80_00735 [Candidatus Eisenbacteria bacterium]